MKSWKDKGYKAEPGKKGPKEAGVATLARRRPAVEEPTFVGFVVASMKR